ncbi:MAG: restriction endonuclease subunit S [Wenzhouxiangella sp.]|nr:MAG: restriction endonuclease subunit S [Wenzhouxiangella sp.]
MDGDFNSRIWDGGKALVNQRVCTLKAHERFYSQKLLAYALPGYLSLINDHTSSVTVKHLSSRTVQDIPLPLPPLNEQHRIVEKIETLFAHIDKGEEALREVQKLLKRYRQSILKAAVTGELTRDWREANQHKLEPASDLLARILETRRENWQGRGKYKEPVAADTSKLPDLPGGWAWATLPMLGELGRGKSKHRPRNDPRLYENGTYPFLQTGRVRNSSGRISEYDKLYSELGLSQSRLWPAGTICITIAANIAESGILDIDACFPDSVVGLIPDAEICAEYIETFVRTAKRDLDRYAPATAQKNINLEILNNLAVPLPPAEEQKEIRDDLDAVFATIDSLEKTCAVELSRASALRQSILKSAFTGELVPQNPNDEPASELLSRIRAERDSKPKKRSKKKAVKKTGIKTR